MKGVVIVAVAALVALAIHHLVTPTRTPQEKMRAEIDFGALPEEAYILDVQPDDWGHDGTVTFRLPGKHPVKTWLTILWEMNPPEKRIEGWQENTREGHVSATDNGKAAFLGGASETLEYNPASKIYRYQVTFDK